MTVKVLGTPIGSSSSGGQQATDGDGDGYFGYWTFDTDSEKKSMFDANQAVHDFYLVVSNAQEKSESPYTNNALRERIKARVMAGSEGGRPGQWSARKAQLVAMRYRKAGGGYKKGKRPSKKQRSLRKWTREKWRTSDGKPALRGGKMRRYLPDKVWGRLSPAQRAATNRKKIQGDKRGQQFVANTDTAKDKARNYRNRSKSLISAYSFKVLGTPIGGVSNVDGDGDGFVTGPTGKDNIPAVNKPIEIIRNVLDSHRRYVKGQKFRNFFIKFTGEARPGGKLPLGQRMVDMVVSDSNQKYGYRMLKPEERRTFTEKQIRDAIDWLIDNDYPSISAANNVDIDSADLKMFKVSEEQLKKFLEADIKPRKADVKPRKKEKNNNEPALKRGFKVNRAELQSLSLNEKNNRVLIQIPNTFFDDFDSRFPDLMPKQEFRVDAGMQIRLNEEQLRELIDDAHFYAQAERADEDLYKFASPAKKLLESLEKQGIDLTKYIKSWQPKNID